MTHLELTDFRSYGRFDIHPDAQLTILVGPNAAGKTNVIEALDLLTAAESFRHPSWGDVVRWGAAEARLALSAEGDGRSLEIMMHATKQGRRTYEVNGKNRRRISEVAGILPCVVFTPDDLRLVKDAADRRRTAVDGVGDQLSPAYRQRRVEYESILRHRNTLLREQHRDDAMLEVWTTRLAEAGWLSADTGDDCSSGCRRRCQRSITHCREEGRSSPATAPSWEDADTATMDAREGP